MVSYFTIWIITAIAGVFGIKIYNGSGKKLISISRGFFPCIVLCFFAGARALSVGKDNKAYSIIFLKMTYDKVKLFQRGSIGIYNLWSFVIRHFTDNVYIFNFCCAVFIYLSLYFFIHEYSEDELLSVMLFFGLGMFYNSMNQTRQAMAFSLLLWAFFFVTKKSIPGVIVCCGLSVLVHNIAIVMLPFFVVLTVIPRVTEVMVWIMSGVAIGIAFLYKYLVLVFVYIFPRYSKYLKISNLLADRRSIYRYGDLAIALLVQLFLLYGIRVLRKNNESTEKACLLACMNALNICMAYLVLNGGVFIRLKGLCNYWMVISIPYIVSTCFRGNRYIKLCVYILSVGYLLRLGVKDGDGVIPYYFFWS